ncbi:MAG: M48 family metallopeptidase [Patescibacteria group bacterium]
MKNATIPSIYTQRRRNIIRTWLIILTFGLVVLGIAFVFAYWYQDVSIVVIALVLAIFSSITSYYFSDKIALKSTGAYQADRNNRSHLRIIRMVENMAITAGIPTPRVHIIDDPAPNAFATGRNPEHASVAFTTGLLEILNDAELEGVVAHEISHIGNRDILVGTIVVIMIGFIALLADIFMRMGMLGSHKSGEGGPAAGVTILIVFALAIFSPLIGKLIQAAVSRKREYLADASGALLTRYPEGLAQALIKIQSHAQPLQNVSQATSHLFIANPFLGADSIKDSFRRLVSTHPPIEKRVQALTGKEMQRALEEHQGE